LTGRPAAGLIFGMIAKFNRKSLAFGIPGLLLQIGCGAGFAVLGYTTAVSGQTPAEWIGNLLRIGYYGGTILLIIGLSEYAMSKRRHVAWGLFGAVSCVGLVILVCLKDKMGNGVKSPFPSTSDRQQKKGILNKNRRYALIIALGPPAIYACCSGLGVLFSVDCIVWYAIGAAVWLYGSYKSGDSN
jgi:hypothetical protein